MTIAELRSGIMATQGMTSADSTQSTGGGTLGSGSASDPDSLENNFLTMLTTELKNQDPMNPMDSSQMVTQLSQISASQGIADLKNLTQTELMAMLGGQRLSSSQLIGKTVDYKLNDLSVKGASTNYSGTLDTATGSTDTITLKITDQNNNVVKTISVSPNASGQYTWQWDGKNDAGNPVAVGSYQVAATASDGTTVPVLESNKVNKVTFTNDGGTELIFDDGDTTDIQNVATIEA